MSSPDARHKAAIFGCSGTALTEAERGFFRAADPLGFILFQRNCRDPDQIRTLVASLREAVGRFDAPVLIDQEGGRVARLKPPCWCALPAAGRIGALYDTDTALGLEAAWLSARLAAADLGPLGVDVNCVPVLDVRTREAKSEIIGDRSYGPDPLAVGALARSAVEGCLAGGVLPVVKHIPGHGRADADSHFELPVVVAADVDLDDTDLAPFRALANAPLAMTAHVLYPVWDPDRPATTSPTVVHDIIRRRIGFEGLLLSDDLSMQALDGTLADRTVASLAAGCDVVLHCNGRAGEMGEVAAACAEMTEAADRRWRAAASLRRPPEPFDVEAGAARLDALLAGLSA